jgi:transcriptional antiterminator RfaH
MSQHLRAVSPEASAVAVSGGVALLPGRPRTSDAAWHVLHTKSRNEKALREILGAMGIACYLPLRRVVRRAAGRRTESDLPVFPGYVFLWGSRDDAFRADRTRRVARIVPVADQAGLERDLANVHRAVAAGGVLEPFPWIRDGVRVRVVSGPFLGVEGVVVSRTATDRLLLQVRMLNTSAGLDISGESVESIEP